MRGARLSIFISHPSQFLTNCQPHGDGLIAFEFINQLAGRGHTLHVAAAAMNITGELPENVKLYPIKTRAASYLHRFEYMVKVRQTFNEVRRRHKIDLIHQLNPVTTGVSLLLMGVGLPVVLGPFWPYWPHHQHDLENTGSALKRGVFKACSYQQQRRSAGLIMSTPAALAKLHRPESVIDKVYNLPPGINAAAFTPNYSDAAREEEISILFLANLERNKGIFTLLDGFEIVAAALPRCRLLIAGAGSQLEAVRHRVSRMACQSQISLLGNVERTRVAEVMRRSTVYCLPSYGEPFGMSALEAMACGKPVVATDAGGLAHLVTEQGGRKVPPENGQALADALLEILRSPELQEKMGRHNRRLVENVYSWERVTERLEAIYYDVLAGGTKRHPVAAEESLLTG